MQSNHKLINITNIKFVAKCITKYTSLFSKKKKKGMSQKLAQKKYKKNMSLFGMYLNNSF